ncbi:MAG TPA: hypothetical protein VH061_09825 [Solirubrobacteraceae bacterium]|jgi:hypothetical protein|nr:hypothetical protein [Solirubrobacteraceae bacterium]
MTGDVIAKAILVAGSLLLVLGPGLQARLEMREYHDLLEGLMDSNEIPETTRRYLSLLAIGPSSTLHSPLAALRFLGTLAGGWYGRHRIARREFRAAGGGADERVTEIRSHLVRARNWAIVVAGSVLIFSGSSVELVHVIVTGHGG